MNLAGGYADPSQASADYDDDDDDPTVVGSSGKRGNVLSIFGNQQTMNINPLIVTNIVGSPYFKVSLFGLKTYHEVVDEIYYKVAHLEPWERGSRKTSGQTGMCGGVRGVGAGGIVSSAYCLLLKLTRKQVNGLINHSDSPYIRGLAMYIRYSQPPQDFWEWYEGYLDDEEEIDVKAGGGKLMTIGEMVRAFMERLEWFDTRFPRIPVNVQKQINQSLEAYRQERIATFRQGQVHQQQAHYSNSHEENDQADESEKPRRRSRSHSRSRDHQKRDERRDRSRDRDKDKRRERDGSRDRDRKRDNDRDKDRDRDRKRESSRDRDRQRDRDRDRSRRSRSRSRERKHHKKSKKRSRSRSRDRSSKRSMTYEQELKRYSEHREKHKKSRKSRSRSRSRD